MKMEMVPRAIEPVQAAVLVKRLQKRERVEVPDKELEEEIDRILLGVKDKESETAFHPPNTRDYVAAQMRNRKTIELLKEKAVKGG